MKKTATTLSMLTLVACANVPKQDTPSVDYAEKAQAVLAAPRQFVLQKTGDEKFDALVEKVKEADWYKALSDELKKGIVWQLDGRTAIAFTEKTDVAGVQPGDAVHTSIDFDVVNLKDIASKPLQGYITKFDETVKAAFEDGLLSPTELKQFEGYRNKLIQAAQDKKYQDPVSQLMVRQLLDETVAILTYAQNHAQRKWFMAIGDVNGRDVGLSPGHKSGEANPQHIDLEEGALLDLLKPEEKEAALKQATDHKIVDYRMGRTAEDVQYWTELSENSGKKIAATDKVGVGLGTRISPTRYNSSQLVYVGIQGTTPGHSVKDKLDTALFGGKTVE